MTPKILLLLLLLFLNLQTNIKEWTNFRPENPIDYLAQYLLEKNPMKPPPKNEEKIAEVSPEAPKKEEK
jgi:hypothetical protein